MKIDIHELNRKLDRALIPPRVIFKGARFGNDYQRSPEFQDPRYYPFYYYLAGQIKPRRVLQIGSRGGYIAFAFCKTSESVVQWSFHPHSPYSSIAESNAQANIADDFGLVRFLPEIQEHDKYDLVIISDKFESEKQLEYLNTAFDHLVPEGLLVVDYITDESAEDVFSRFCKARNREPVRLDTRYHVSIIER